MPGTAALEAWVEECAQLTRPDSIVWINGSEEEYQGLARQMMDAGMLTQLDEAAYPNSYLYRSDPSDVART